MNRWYRNRIIPLEIKPPYIGHLAIADTKLCYQWCLQCVTCSLYRSSTLNLKHFFFALDLSFKPVKGIKLVYFTGSGLSGGYSVQQCTYQCDLRYRSMYFSHSRGKCMCYGEEDVHSERCSGSACGQRGLYKFLKGK